MRKESRISTNRNSFFVVFAVLMLSICFASVNAFGVEAETTKEEEIKKKEVEKAEEKKVGCFYFLICWFLHIILSSSTR